MKTLKFLFPLLAVISMLFFSACIKGGDDDPGGVPKFSMTGNVDFENQNFKMNDWHQIASALTEQEIVMSVGFSSDNDEGILLYSFLDGAETSDIMGTHELSKLDKFPSRFQTVNPTQKIAWINSGSITIDKVEKYDLAPSGNIWLLSGSFTFGGATDMGETVTSFGSFENLYFVRPL